MKEYNEIGTDEMLEWARMNGMNLSEGQANELIEGYNKDIDIDKWFEENSINPIGDYESLSKKMRLKIKEIISSLKESEKTSYEDINDSSQSDDRDEKDTLDEKDGKEELTEDKKKEKEDKKLNEQDEKNIEKDDEHVAKEKEQSYKENKEENKEEIPKKEEYLANVEKLHRMKIADYRDQLKRDDVKLDKYFITMIYLQRKVSRTRNAFVKEYGDEDLIRLENQHLREEQKYQKTLDIRMEKDLDKLRHLDEKLDSILDRMQTLQNRLEKGNIDIEEYNKEIDNLEKDKLDTLWKINRLNPTLLEQKQEIIEQRHELQYRKVPRNIQKERNVNTELKAKQKNMEYMEKKQEDVAENVHKDMKASIQSDIDKKEKRLDELRKELKRVNIETAEGKKHALEIIGEIQTLESQKASQEIQQENLEKNMRAGMQSYGDLENSEVKRQDDVEEFKEINENINPDEVSNDLMAELRNAAMKDPSTPEQAEEYLNNIKETTEDISKNNDGKMQDNDGNEPPTLWNRRKRPY